MFGKNLVIELGPKTLSTNQISGFFKPQYLKNKLRYEDDFLHVGRHP